MRLAVVAALLAACTSPTLDRRAGPLGADQARALHADPRQRGADGRLQRALLAGIAISETGLAHCHSEATYGCPGPASSSCGGGPIIAGGADGPCADMQGGLGMFQFDAGTYAQTVAAYGPDILTIEGNTAQAVWFVIDKVEQDIADVADWLAAAAWMNHVPLDAADAGDEPVGRAARVPLQRLLPTSVAVHVARERLSRQRDHRLQRHGRRLLATRSAARRPRRRRDRRRAASCYVAGGDPRYWRHEHRAARVDEDDRRPGRRRTSAQWIVKAQRRPLPRRRPPRRRRVGSRSRRRT